MRAACLAGYTPDLFGCHICGSQNPDRFDLSAGQLSCRGCASGEHGIRMPVTAGMLEAMRYVCLCDPKRLFSFQIGEQTLEQLSSLTESYLQTQLERGFSALDFYKSLLI
jgi:DNA repair protein RecO (recombination protein O)